MNRRQITKEAMNGGTRFEADQRGIRQARRRPPKKGTRVPSPFSDPRRRYLPVLEPKIAVGSQLAGRVRSGAITGAQAQQTARQRQTLKAAFGDDWRKQVYGPGGARASAKGAFGRPATTGKRALALERAKRKLSTR